MTNKGFYLSFILLSFSLLSFSQKPNKISNKEIQKKVFLEQKNTLSFSPFPLLLHQGILTYERRFGNKNAIVFQSAFKMSGNKKGFSHRHVKNLKFNTEIQYKRYLTYFQLRKNKFPETRNAFGVYIAPLVNYEYGEQHFATKDYDMNNIFVDYSESKFYNAIQGGVLAGINFDIIYGKLSIQLNGGVAYKHSWVVHNQTHNTVRTYNSMNSGILYYAFTGLVPKLNFQLGFNF